MSRTAEALSPDLFSLPAYRNSDPETSRQAAARCPAIRRADLLEVLRIHAEHPAGLSDFQLADIMKRKQTSVGKRRGELRDMGLIVQTAERRPSDTGSPAICWRITEAGKKAAELKGS